MNYLVLFTIIISLITSCFSMSRNITLLESEIVKKSVGMFSSLKFSSCSNGDFLPRKIVNSREFTTKALNQSLQINEERRHLVNWFFERRLMEIGVERRARRFSCFISHAWASNKAEKKEDEFSDNLNIHLDLAGIETFYDGRRDSRGIIGGTSIPQFMDRMDSSDYLVMIYTPAYKVKYERGTGIATEIDFIVYTANKKAKEGKLIPILFSGDPNSSIPSLLMYRNYYDFRDSENYHENLLKNVISHIMNQDELVFEKLSIFRDEKKRALSGQCDHIIHEIVRKRQLRDIARGEYIDSVISSNRYVANKKLDEEIDWFNKHMT